MIQAEDAKVFAAHDGLFFDHILRSKLRHKDLLQPRRERRIVDRRRGRLIVQQVYDHQGNVGQATTPLLVFDAWEHAYYLQYRTKKADYFTALWNLWNWEDVRERFARASEVDLGLDNAILGDAGEPATAAPA